MTFTVTGKDVFFLALIVNTGCFFLKETLLTVGVGSSLKEWAVAGVVVRGIEVPGDWKPQ